MTNAKAKATQAAAEAASQKKAAQRRDVSLVSYKKNQGNDHSIAKSKRRK